jgi:ABC-type ATPase involved in cell division/GNAT superfamily N-acetyltransferase
MPGDRELSEDRMPRIQIRRSCPIVETPRVKQMQGIFDVAPAARSEVAWDCDVTLPDAWNVGLIVGPSGAGKSTAARELFGDRLVERWDWPADRCVLDGFPAELGIKDVTELLSSVGFSTPPAWLRPFHVLSTGEQFRVDLARTLAELPDLAVVDEFTSVVDRQVARVGAAAVAKAVRRRGRRFVAVSCHYDILDWLDPDWVFQPHTGALDRRCLRGRPTIELDIYPAGRSAWPLFEPHHYLSTKLHTAAHSFVALYEGRPVAFDSYLHFPHPKVSDIKIGHRLVVLPDYQGLGIGGRFEEWLGEYLHTRGYRYHNVTAHTALIAYCLRSPRWRLTSKAAALSDRKKKITSEVVPRFNRKQREARRLATVTFEYIPVRRAA